METKSPVALLSLDDLQTILLLPPLRTIHMLNLSPKPTIRMPKTIISMPSAPADLVLISRLELDSQMDPGQVVEDYQVVQVLAEVVTEHPQPRLQLIVAHQATEAVTGQRSTAVAVVTAQIVTKGLPQRHNLDMELVDMEA
jgi:hypothetical protein